MSNDNIAYVQNLYAAFGRGDVPAIVAGCAPDIEWQSGGSSDHFPAFGTRSGPNGVAEFFRLVGETNEFNAFTPRGFHASGDTVFVLGHYSITLRKNGRRIDSDWVHIFTIANGKVTKFREFLDTAAAADAWRG
jgi:ketosteroid isomerase-like protein